MLLELLIEAKTNQQAKHLLDQANILLDGHRYQEAIETYDKAIAIQPVNVEAWINRGIGLTSLQRYQDALASYDKAIAIEPRQDKAWYNRGIALTSLQRYQDALGSYNKAIAIKPDKYEAWINRGITLTKLQRYQDALASYDKAIALKPDQHEAYYNKACLYALQGNLKVTIENLNIAIKLNRSKYGKLAKTDPDFAKVRGDKRFQQLIE